MDEKLSPCPFCGGEVELSKIGHCYDGNERFKIECKKCKLTMLSNHCKSSPGDPWPDYDEVKQALLEQWHTRVADLRKGKYKWYRVYWWR